MCLYIYNIYIIYDNIFISIPGKCPLNPYNHGCLADYIGCQFDSECDGANKCCKNMHCGYNDCQAP